MLARLKDLSKGAAKKVVRRPQPKLDATRYQYIFHSVILMMDYNRSFVTFISCD